MKHLRNPISGEAIACTPLEAKRLLRYGWQPISREAYHKVQREKLAYIIQRQLRLSKITLH